MGALVRLPNGPGIAVRVFARRRTLARWGLVVVVASAAWAGSAPAQAQTSAAVPQLAMPIYSAEHALTGLYAHHLPPLSQAFQAQADALVLATQRHCAALPSQGAGHAGLMADWSALHTQWQHTMAAWETLSTPAVGPVLTRRSQRQIDFWPTRHELLGKALDKAPQTLTDMERIGTLAKGLPAFETLLARPGPMPPATCHYLVLVAQGVSAEGRELGAELATWAAKNWTEQSESDVEVTRAALVEWLNQWLGGVERLRWMHLEKPIKTAQTLGNKADSKKESNPLPFARLGRDANLAGWRAQWDSLKAQGQLTTLQRQQPPVPGQALVPIEALLLGKGHIALAQRWAQALDGVSARLAALPQQAPESSQPAPSTAPVASALKAVTVLYQNEVATALDIPLGFSDADGD